MPPDGDFYCPEDQILSIEVDIQVTSAGPAFIGGLARSLVDYLRMFQPVDKELFENLYRTNVLRNFCKGVLQLMPDPEAVFY